MKQTTLEIFEKLFSRRPELADAKESILQAFEAIAETFCRGGVLYVCGNGGSAADSEHIVGELMKSFKKKRPVSDEDRSILMEKFGESGRSLSLSLEYALPAVSLCSGISLNTAVCNDTDPSNVYAQQLFGLGRAGDCLLAISTSGNAENCMRAAMVALFKDMSVIGLTGESGGRIKTISDVCVCVPSNETYAVQEMHLPIYHCLCAMLEEEFF